jgi:chromosome segregation ATPase
MLRAVFLAALAALTPLAALAQANVPSTSYRCVGTDGKKYYSSTVPTQCIGQPVEQLNNQGMVIKRFDAAASAAEREKKAAEEEERKKREAVSKEEGRRNRALLATYTSERDIDQARARALQENEAAVKEIEKRISGLKTRLAALKKEMDFYTGKNQPPAKLSSDIRSAEFDIKTQEDLLATKKREVNQINTRYDDDKKRYAELTKGGSGSAAAAPAPAVTKK